MASDTTFETSEKLDYLFKKAFYKPCTSNSREYFQEPTITSRPSVYQEDILSHSLPATVPTDLTNLGDASLDDNGHSLKGSYAGKTSSTDSNIRYYHKIPLEAISGTDGAAYQAQNASTSHPGGYADGSTASKLWYSWILRSCNAVIHSI